MVEQIDVVVIGAGQAGLSIAYYLAQMGRQYVILEKDSTTVPAWRGRWESFTLVLPNWTFRLPDNSYEGDDPDGFLDRDEVVDTFEKFAASFEPEIRFGQTVTSIEQNPDGDNYLVRTQDKVIEANNVVVAVGTFQKPRIPAFSQAIPKSVTQLHSSDYVNPSSLAEGAVMVVGTGQSGSQIADELYRSGRRVYLSVSGAMRVPRRYRGRDSIAWLVDAGFFDQTQDKLSSSRDRFKANPFLSGKDGGRSLDLHQFARDGVFLLGRMGGAEGNTVVFKPDLHDNLRKIDDFVADWKNSVDTLIAERNLAAEEARNHQVMTDGYASPVVETLDVTEERINTIIWATGYEFDFSWIKLPLLDEDGYPIQERGVSAYPGLYFLGLHFMHRRKSGLLMGVGDDAAYVAQAIAAR